MHISGSTAPTELETCCPSTEPQKHLVNRRALPIATPTDSSVAFNEGNMRQLIQTTLRVKKAPSSDVMPDVWGTPIPAMPLMS